jgi:hypothetical protein
MKGMVITMKENLRNYIDNLFAQAPNTPKVMELKEELLSNLAAKYDDLITQGRSEDDAYKIAVGGIGDVNELIKGLENDKIYNYARQESDRRKSAMLVSIAVGLYIISIASVILCTMIPAVGPEAGAVVMFIIAAIATSLLVFSAMSRPKYRRSDNTIVEEFKEWKDTSSQNRQVYRSVVSAMWPLIVVIYLILSFVFGSWAYSWIIFLIGVALQHIIKLVFEMRK